MDREIKFRSWDGVRMSTMYITFNTSTGLLEVPKIESLSGNQLKNEIHIMQFTGLVDRNGVDIYEGDIVAIPYIDPMGNLTDSIDYYSTVQFLNGSFVIRSSFESDKPKCNLSIFCKMDKREYISNYGEHTTYLPELIIEVTGNIHTQQPNKK